MGLDGRAEVRAATGADWQEAPFSVSLSLILGPHGPSLLRGPGRAGRLGGAGVLRPGIFQSWSSALRPVQRLLPGTRVHPGLTF